MNESACQFGEGNRLAGIVIEPPSAHPEVACVIVTAGLAPKFGPFRLYAALARRLAQAGFTTLRFDLGGVGDSAPGRAGATLTERTDEEIRAALDHVTRIYHIQKILLCGSCSGAENAFRYAAQDERVVGVAMIDPFGYRTAGLGLAQFPASRGAPHAAGARTLRALALQFGGGTGAGRDHARLVQYQYLQVEESERILKTSAGARHAAAFHLHRRHARHLQSSGAAAKDVSQAGTRQSGDGRSLPGIRAFAGAHHLSANAGGIDRQGRRYRVSAPVM